MTKFSAHGNRECKSAVSTGNKSKKEKVKNEVLTGWKTENVDDEFDIVAWSKKRETQEGKPVTERRASQITKWDNYVCTVVKKCRSIEKVQVYMDNSLSVTLKPAPSHLEKEPVKVKLKHSLSQLQLISEKHPVILEQTQHEISEENEGSSNNAKKSIQNNKSKDNNKKGEDNGKENIKEGDQNVPNTGSHDCKNVDKSQTENCSTESNADKVLSEQTDNEHTEALHDTTEVNPDAIDSHLIGINDTNSEILSESDKNEERDIVEKPVPVARFGYTNANISLSGVNLYEPVDGEEENSLCSTSRHRSGTYKPSVIEMETIAQLSRQENGPAKNQKRTLHTSNLTSIPLVPGYIHTRPRSGRRERILTSKSESNVQSMDEETSMLAVKKKKGEQDISGMTVASIRTARHLNSPRASLEQKFNIPSDSNTDDTADKYPTMSQKQVLLVLKNVTLKDGFDDYHPSGKSSYTSPRTSSSISNQANNGFRQIENLINRAASRTKHQDSSHHLEHSGRQQHGAYFPLADLLPAVDNSIRNSMPARYIRQLDTLAFAKNESDSGKSLMMSEDKIFNMNDGIEFLRQRNDTLGRPTFRPPTNKTPLQRAKENTKKRLDSSNLSQTAQQMTETDKAKWVSSAGTLYQKSRPGSTDENLMIKQDKNSPERSVTPIPYCTGKYKPPPWISKTPSAKLYRLSRQKHKNDTFVDFPRADKELQQVSKALNSRLHDLARQRSSQQQEIYDRSPVS